MLESADSLAFDTPAKVNLCLEVLRRKANGYHDLQSVVMPVSLCDRVRLWRTAGPVETFVDANGLEDRGPCSLLHSAQNLATRAALVVRRAAGFCGGVRIHIQKRIPVGGGLGGGSADAAAVLIGVNRLWGTGFSREQLMELGAGIGSDVPVLVRGGPACMRGQGEQVTELESGPGVRWWMVLANPCIPVSTRDVYTRFKGPLTSAHGYLKSMLSALSEGDVRKACSGLYNSLQETVFRKYPLIEMLAERLAEAGALGVLLCGSGASVLGLARDEGDAAAIRDRLRQRMDAPVWVRVVHTVPDGVTVAHGPLEARV